MCTNHNPNHECPVREMSQVARRPRGAVIVTRWGLCRFFLGFSRGRDARRGCPARSLGVFVGGAGGARFRPRKEAQRASWYLFVSQCVRFAKGIRGESAVFNQFWYLEGHYTSVLTSVLTCGVARRCLCRWCFFWFHHRPRRLSSVFLFWGVLRNTTPRFVSVEPRGCTHYRTPKGSGDAGEVSNSHPVLPAFGTYW